MNKLQEQLETELKTIAELKEEFCKEEGEFITEGGYTREGNRYIDAEYVRETQTFIPDEKATAEKRQHIKKQLEKMMEESKYYSVKYFCAMALERQNLDSLFSSYIKELQDKLTSSDPEEKQRAILDLKRFYTHPESSEEMIEASGKLLHYSNLRILFRKWFNTIMACLICLGCLACLSPIIIIVAINVSKLIKALEFYTGQPITYILLICVAFLVICSIINYVTRDQKSDI